MKVYILTSGCYSDYRVNAIVSSEEYAKSLQASHFCDAYKEFELDNLGEDELKKDKPEYHIIMNYDTGNVTEIFQSEYQSVEPSYDYYSDYDNKKATPDSLVFEMTHEYPNWIITLSTVMQGYDSKEHAIKVLNEIRIQFKLRYDQNVLTFCKYNQYRSNNLWYVNKKTLDFIDKNNDFLRFNDPKYNRIK